MASQLGTRLPVSSANKCLSRPSTGNKRLGTASSFRLHDRKPQHLFYTKARRGESREVGIAALDKDTGRVMPVQILFDFIAGGIHYIREEFPGVQIEPVGRRYGNDAGGLEFVLQLCIEDEREGTVLGVSNKCAYIPIFHVEISWLLGV
ncbi:hypothetical protein B0H34DRAFT_670581 [Crassisporium funariophilum]|nr:hypothetical protein B0H34DRAFT_670581 [Crassisporium funariophilum]